MSGTDRLSRLADVLADRTVLPGYSRLGYRLRQRHWPADPAPDALAGRTAVATGASAGLGRATAIGLARLGATVLLLVRDESRGERARDAVLQTVPQADVHVARCDVADLDDVDRCAGQVRRDHPVIDVLVHNAGVLPQERTETPQSHESTLATHVLGPLRLTERLRPALARSTDARVLLVSSGGMYTQSIPADDLEYRHGRYRGAVAYSRTKRLQVAFTPLLSQRYAAERIGVHSLHPGWVDTPGVTGSLPGFQRVMAPLLRSPAEGADTAVWLAATHPAPPSGRFWHDRRPRPDHYLPGRGDDPRAVRRAWRHCLDAAGIDQDRED
ncbi:NAD(P)-dependent dehydrogenase (short-subunit alcohol dehydrogenase family) [Prauserella sediminis]|uniref:NAD(P)-dependent dehydrogenase (Short-subunit alcohol dehydrogenase family) n=1 Tax=Prauserella sediminis TaxID=577680 RepID=A0A839XPI4_9PSEU|nr:SDR family NAD(P)-dependent oxidoreductase [Prauserella sediminis]MBB3662593.1 NAD(P)-dependent dehydrogenase (short-subunit alcohol dehydrogenase family) [Prauserella sediminis]